jgi:epoxyqueuosine reductase
MLEKRLGEWAAARGYRLATADVTIIEAVRQKLEHRRASGLIDGTFFQENLTKFRYLDGSTIKGPKRLVLIAVPSPVSVVSLQTGGGSVEALIPPTYIRYNATFQDVLDDMKTSALGGRARAEIVKAPLKSLAAHMGLVRYGRNNITYAEGLGSGFQLCGYIVGTRERREGGDAGPGGAESRLGRCAKCTACVKICPTGAIREDRFLIAAERCFTLHSERRDPVPEWVRPPETPCLIGCMACQRVCPENRGRLKTVRAELDLTGEEVAEFLEAGRKMESGSSGQTLHKTNRVLRSARAKFERLGLAESFEVMGRNLGYFIRYRSSVPLK